MDLSLKQRLIGGAVIVALAVIFVPMLLDGSGQREQTTVDIEIPPEPAFTFEQQQTGADEPQQPAVAKPLPEPGGSASQTPPPPETIATPEPQPEQTAAATPEKTPEVPATAAPEPTAGVEGGWVVQVGSFTKQNNAVVLSDKLRAAGFKSFVEPSGEGLQKVYRVKVGPEPGRDKAKALEARLLAEQKLKGIVVSHK